MQTRTNRETPVGHFNLPYKFEEQEVPNHLSKKNHTDLVVTGPVFAHANMVKHPRTWRVSGVFTSALSQQFMFAIRSTVVRARMYKIHTRPIRFPYRQFRCYSIPGTT